MLPSFYWLYFATRIIASYFCCPLKYYYSPSGHVADFCCHFCFRLEAYDRNANFTDADDVTADNNDWTMLLPEPDAFRDVTSAKRLPHIALADADAFLQPHDTCIDSTAKELYNARYALYVDYFGMVLESIRFVPSYSCIGWQPK